SGDAHRRVDEPQSMALGHLDGHFGPYCARRPGSDEVYDGELGPGVGRNPDVVAVGPDARRFEADAESGSRLRVDAPRSEQDGEYGCYWQHDGCTGKG